MEAPPKGFFGKDLVYPPQKKAVKTWDCQTSDVAFDPASLFPSCAPIQGFKFPADIRITMKRLFTTTLLAGLGLLVASELSAQAPLEVTFRVSESAAAEANGVSYQASVSGDGRYVAFESQADNLVAGDTNGTWDVFVYDHLLGSLERVSLSSAGVEGNYGSLFASISADGRFVAFHSFADNLVAGDSNWAADVFVRDRLLNTTTRVSVDSAGTEANGYSYDPAISGNGTVVAFRSEASNLVAGDSNGVYDIFVHDLTTGITERVSLSSLGAEANGECSAPAISFTGNRISFSSVADNLVPADSNGQADVFLRDRWTASTQRISLSSSGTEANGPSELSDLSANGNFIAFESDADNLVLADGNAKTDIFVRDLSAGTTIRVSVDSDGNEGSGWCWWPSISSSGQYVAFQSSSFQLVPTDNNMVRDVFVYDRESGLMKRCSLASDATEGNGSSYSPALSGDGRYVAYHSSADNLVASDGNGLGDLFLFDQRTGGATLDLIGLAAGSVATLEITGATPMAPIPVAASLSGQGELATPFGILNLALPLTLLNLFANGSGSASLNVSVPATLAGSPLWVQGADTFSGLPTTTWAGMIP